MKDPLRLVASLVGIYGGLIGAAHGIFEIQQGSMVPEGVMINAIGPPCQPEAVAHACFPALTLIPNFLITGIAALLLSLLAVVWAGFFIHRKRGGLVHILLSGAMLLVGAGFVPLFLGLIAGGVGSRIGKPLSLARKFLPAPLRSVLANGWPWALGVYFLYALGFQNLGGVFFPAVMLEYGGLFFLLEYGVLFLAVLTAFAARIERSS
jgi:hypothetical protein